MKYRERKQHVVEAEEFDGSDEQLQRFKIRKVKHDGFRHGPAHDYFIDVREGTAQAKFGDMLVTDSTGEIALYRPDVFAAVYVLWDTDVDG